MHRPSELRNHRPVVIGLGEILWDVFPDGSRFGGAPANFACSTAALSDNADVHMVSAVGNDDLGQEALRQLSQRNVQVAHVAVRDQPTGTVQVTLDEEGHASYKFAEDTAWDHLEYHASVAQLAAQADAVCFGTLGQRSSQSADTIQHFVRATPAHCLRIFDINLRPPFFNDDVVLQSLECCSILKLNDDELALAARLSEASGTVDQQLAMIAKRWQLHAVALTLGADGAKMWHRDRVLQADGVPTTIKDTVGAGDAFTATLATGLLAEVNPQKILQRACEVAAWVCSQDGGTPAIPEQLKF
jgi:fructokinase